MVSPITSGAIALSDNNRIASATPITTSITSSSTDTEAPSAKAVYGEIGGVEDFLSNVNSGE